MKNLRRIAIMLIVLALLAGAQRIVEQRNRAFFTPGQKSSSMPMH